MATRVILKVVDPSTFGAAPTGYKYLYADSTTDTISEKTDSETKEVGGKLVSTTILYTGEILTMGSNPVELLPAPGVNNYYDVEKVVLEYVYNTTAFALNTQLALRFGGELSYYVARIPYALITLTKSAACVVNNFMSTDLLGTNISVPAIQPTNEALTIGTSDTNNPINGDGSLRVTTYYEVRTILPTK